MSVVIEVNVLTGIIMKKLTVTVPDAVYRGLYDKIGEWPISRFLNNWARAHVVDADISATYKAMSQDESREQETATWSENLLGDLSDDTW